MVYIKRALFYFRIRNQTTTKSICEKLSQNYFTSELEIKPQLIGSVISFPSNYFTSELEIKPQPTKHGNVRFSHYFTSELEIKPQLMVFT